MPFRTDTEVEILIAADGRLTIEGQEVTLENGSVESGCIVGSLRGPGVFVPKVSIPLDMCRMAAGHQLVVDDEDPS
jgi:hypothetical protein